MVRNSTPVRRIKTGVDQFVNRTVDATLYLPLGIYDRARDQLTDLDAKRVRKTFEGLIGDFIDRGQDRVQPLERRLRRETRKVGSRFSNQVSDPVTEAKTTATTTAKKTTKRAKKTTARAKKTTKTTARKASARTAAAASNAQPKLPRVTAPRTASELPIARYGSLTVDEITQRLTGLTQTDLAKVFKYEKAHKNRATILASVEGKLVDLPIPTYDALTTDEILKRLNGLDKLELKTIKRYESGTKMRATITEKVDALLS